jgi:hypothetical protein
LIKAPPPPPVPRLKPQQQPQPDKQKSTSDTVNAMLNNVLATPTRAAERQGANRTTKGIGAQTAMTADLQDALRSHDQPCWSPQVGAPNAADLVVDFDISSIRTDRSHRRHNWLPICVRRWRAIPIRAPPRRRPSARS